MTWCIIWQYSLVGQASFCHNVAKGKLISRLSAAHLLHYHYH